MGAVLARKSVGPRRTLMIPGLAQMASSRTPAFKGANPLVAEAAALAPTVRKIAATEHPWFSRSSQMPSIPVNTDNRPIRLPALDIE